eukprot:scaffold169_cov279-Chaetoceros_neogracile.AAC.10
MISSKNKVAASSLTILLIMFMTLTTASCFTSSLASSSSLHLGSILITRAENTILPHGGRKRQHTFLAVAPQSLPPVSTEAASTSINSVKDYFIPTSSEEASRRALEKYAQSKENSSGEMIKSSDFIQIDSALPGAKDSKPISRSTAFLPTETYNKEISKKEVLWISQQFDIYMRKLPQAVFIYALLDFFVLPTSRAVMSDELEEDRMAVVKDWAGRAVVRVGVFSTIVAATILFENVFNNSI